jgi:hypothetical protein
MSFNPAGSAVRAMKICAWGRLSPSAPMVAFINGVDDRGHPVIA